MENLNEGKKPRGYMAELAEIDAQSAIVAMEAKINKLEEMAAAKEQRLSMVSEDENLSELISKSAVKEMQKEIKEIRKMQEKLEKLYEKKNGKKMPKMVDEVEELEEETVEEGGYDSNYEEDDSKVDEGNNPEDDGLAYTDGVLGDYMNEGEIDEAHCNTEEDDVREETNEEVNRWQKLAGISVQENKILKEEKYSGAIIRKGSSDKAKEDTKIVRQALKDKGIKFTNRGEFGMDFKDADLAQIKKVIAGAKVGEFIISHDED